MLEAAGSLQLCARQNAGNEAAVHAMIVMIPQRLCCWLMPVMLLLMVGISFPKRGLKLHRVTLTEYIIAIARGLLL